MRLADTDDAVFHAVDLVGVQYTTVGSRVPERPAVVHPAALLIWPEIVAGARLCSLDHGPHSGVADQGHEEFPKTARSVAIGSLFF